MAKNREQKRTILAELSDKIGRSKSIVFTKFDALGVKENEELRKKLAAEDSEYLVTKKTLLKIALENNGLNDVNPRDFDGRIAAVFGYSDEVAPAKVVDEFRKTREQKINFVGGILEHKFLSAQDVQSLAKLPSKQELYAQIVGSLNAPISGFVNVLAGNIRGLVNVLKAIEDKQAAK